MTNATVVILEDDPELQALLERGLSEEGFRPTVVSTGAELLERVDRLAADAFIVDIGLPDADGRDVCQALRSRGHPGAGAVPDRARVRGRADLRASTRAATTT